MKKSIDVYQEIVDKLNTSFYGSAIFTLKHCETAVITMEILKKDGVMVDEICSSDIEFYIDSSIYDIELDGEIIPWDFVVINGY